MALTPFQREVLHHLAGNRSPNSVFAGGTVANRQGARFSNDFDIEHQSAEAVVASFGVDQATLVAAGYRVTQTVASQPRHGFVEVEVEKNGQSVLLDWTHDTAIRFFPAVEDDEFGWRLHDIDIALNNFWHWPAAVRLATTTTSSTFTNGAFRWWHWHGPRSERTPA